MTTTTQGEDAYFELAFSPCLSLVSIVRRFVGEFYTEVIGDAEMTSRIAVATHELLENSARYALDGQASVRIGVAKTPEAARVSITTKNRASEVHLRTLRRELDELIAAPDPQAYYLVLMRRAAKRTDGSGLGLGRIAAETDMRISYRIEADRVTLLAEAQFEGKNR
jgi:anti-sigma regulatory factor (Ser/Thr protein kinase)